MLYYIILYKFLIKFFLYFIVKFFFELQNITIFLYKYSDIKSIFIVKFNRNLINISYIYFIIKKFNVDKKLHKIKRT